MRPQSEKYHGFVLSLTILALANGFSSSTRAQDRRLPTKLEKATFELPTQAKVSEGVAELKSGARLWYWDTGGEGEPMILLHPASMSGAAWQFQQPRFAAKGYRVIGYSRRGYRGSKSESVDTGYASIDLHELMQHLNVERAHLVAAAHGGSFAIDFVLSYPDQVQSLTLVSSLIGISEPDYNAVLSRLLPESFGRLPNDFKELSPSYRASNPEGSKAWLQLSEKARQPNASQSSRRQNKVTWEQLRTIKSPVLLIGGEADLYAPPPLIRMQAANMPTADTAFLPEVGHSAYWEAPVEFNKLVLDFVSRNSIDERQE